MQTLIDFIQELEARNIWYRLDSVRAAIMVITALPGERWEVEFFPDGHVEIERFRSTGEIEGEEILHVLFNAHEDGDELVPPCDASDSQSETAG